MSNSELEFWVTVNDGQNEPRFHAMVRTKTGQPVVLSVRDKETFEPLVVITLPEDACSLIGQALMLASTAKAGEQGQ